jgi:hypothetical protein
VKASVGAVLAKGAIKLPMKCNCNAPTFLAADIPNCGTMKITAFACAPVAISGRTRIRYYLAYLSIKRLVVKNSNGYLIAAIV